MTCVKDVFAERILKFLNILYLLCYDFKSCMAGWQGSCHREAGPDVGRAGNHVDKYVDKYRPELRVGRDTG